jgi:hypothetical protein
LFLCILIFLKLLWCYCFPDFFLKKSLFVNRNADFIYWLCILLFCWICLWELRSFFGWVFRIFRYKIISSSSTDNSTSSFLIWIPFIFFPLSYCSS